MPDDTAHLENSPAINPDVQEALSRKYSDDIIMLLPLKSRKFAVFNSARELCGILPYGDQLGAYNIYNYIEVWHPPKPAPTMIKPDVDLTDLELL